LPFQNPDSPVPFIEPPLAGLTVLHCDKDFDLIASVTGQLAEWLTAP